jgi:L-threonylcarbamoyladenylate synthase
VIQEAVRAIAAGRLAIVPTDTVYGLATTPHRADAVRGLYDAKGRREQQPTALVAADLAALYAAVPGLEESVGRVAAGLLPGPYTLVLPNPGRRFPWLTGGTPDAIGVRVPALAGAGREVLDGVGVYVATSANLPGEREPASVDEVPEELRAAADAVVDAGRLPGVASTVLDLTGPEPRVLRAGAVPADEALRLVATLV